MSRRTEQASACQTDLSLVALLYASDLLDREQAADFERLLHEDQAARDALATATRQVLLANGREEVRPSPAYRHRLRQRLQFFRSTRAGGAARGRRRNNGPLWAILATAASVLLILGVSYLSVPLENSRGTAAPVAKTPAPRPAKLFSVCIEAPFLEEEQALDGSRLPFDPPLARDGQDLQRPRRFLIIIMLN